MTTATEPRFLIQDVGWDGYEAILGAVGDRRVRLTYDRGRLEFMSPSPEHEVYKYYFGRMMDILLEEFQIPFKCLGSTTFRHPDVARGLEPDECFYVANLKRILGKKRFDLAIDPPPDVAIEIDITGSVLDRHGIYAALKVPELWRFDGESLRVFGLQEDGTYALLDWSPTFPGLPLDEIARFAKLSETLDEPDWKRAFRAWVRDQLVPREREPGDQAG